MSEHDVSEVVIQRLLEVAQDRDRVEVPVSNIVSFIRDELLIEESVARETWEAISSNFRKVTIRTGYTMQWNFVRNSFTVVRILAPEEVEGIAEIYQRATPAEIELKIRGLSGTEFERFLAALLTRQPEFKNISLTPATRDGEVDFTGDYLDRLLGRQCRLIGQAKQWAVPISASIAREFIGTMALARATAPIGVMVCTGGFTGPAADALDSSQYSIVRWDMETLLRMSRGIATKQIDISFSVPDDTFWGEVIG